MSPHLHSTVADRYTLTSELRVQPGFSAWLATDSTLGRDCQLFMVSDPALTARANAITSSLVLSSNPYFTPVRQLLRDGDASLIVTDLDEGVSVHELLEHGQMFGPEGMRAILCELCDAADSLLEVSLNHQGICAGTVRLIPGGIRLADAPVSCVIRPWVVDGEQSIPDEQLAIKQIAGVLFAMITGKDFMPGVNDVLPDAFHKEGLPDEYAAICSRALGIPAVAGKKPVDLLTLREMRVLLGDPVAWDKLTDADLPPLDGQGAPSISQVALAPTMESEERKAKEEDEARQEEAARKAKEAERKAKEASWDAGQLLFAGGRAVEDVEPSEDTNFLAPLEDAPAPAEPEEPAAPAYVNTLNSRKTMMMDVSQIRQTVASGSDDEGDEATQPMMKRPSAPAPALPDRPQEGPAAGTPGQAAAMAGQSVVEPAAVEPANDAIDESELVAAADSSLAVIVAETEAVEAAKEAKAAQAKAIAEAEAPALPPRPVTPAAAAPAAPVTPAPVTAASAHQTTTPKPAMPAPPVTAAPAPAASARPAAQAVPVMGASAAGTADEPLPPVIRPAAQPVKPLIDEDEDATTLPPSFAPAFPPQSGYPAPDAMLAGHGDDAGDEGQPKRSRVGKVVGTIIGVLAFLGLIGGGVYLAIDLWNSHSGSSDQKDDTGWPGLNENDVPFPGKNGSTTGSSAQEGVTTIAAVDATQPASADEPVVVPGPFGW